MPLVSRDPCVVCRSKKTATMSPRSLIESEKLPARPAPALWMPLGLRHSRAGNIDRGVPPLPSMNPCILKTLSKYEPTITPLLLMPSRAVPADPG